MTEAGLLLCSHELDVEEVPQLTAEEAWSHLGLQVNPQPQ